MSPRAAAIYCSCCLLLFAFLAYSAALKESATFDEPSHVMSSYVALRDGDFRVEPDHPPLWKYWAALPNWFAPFDARTDSPAFRGAPANVQSTWTWCVSTLYRTPGNDADRILARSRFMMLLLGVALGAMAARLAYRLAGPVAACAVATLFCLDPNLLAHSPLVKNDVALALCITALTYALYLACQSITLPRTLGLALLCAACVTTKLTGVLAAPIVVLTLVARALVPVAWPVVRPFSSSVVHPLPSHRSRLLAAFGICVTCFLLTYITIWLLYRARFSPAPDPTVHYAVSQFLDRAAGADLMASTGRTTVTPEEFASWRPDATLRIALWTLDHHLLPEAFLDGVIYTSAAARSRYSFALGVTHLGGRWYYFPLAFFSKTPLVTLAVLLSSVLASIYLFRGRRAAPATSPQSRTSLLPLAVSSLVVLAATLPAGVNIGLRHILPLYPLLFIAASIPLARLQTFRPRVTRIAYPVAALLLAFETLSIYPHFIPFFNRAVGGPDAAIFLLGDSNLDWGQDLPLLADWQKRNPTRTLHLAYFGSADPAYYGIRYHNLPHGYRFDPANRPTRFPLPTTGVLAISASTLQRTDFPDPTDPPYTPLLQYRPTQILGHSIYLYDLGGD